MAATRMREQDFAAGYPSIAPPYGADARDGKHDEGSERLVEIPAGGPRVSDPTAMVLERLGIDDATFRGARRAATANGSDSAGELIAAGRLDAAAFADTAAAVLGIGRCDPLRPAPPEPGAARPRRILRSFGSEAHVLIAPRLEDLALVADFIDARPALASQLRVASEAELAATRARASERQRADDARLGLSRERLDLSARVVLTGAQGFVAGLALVGLAALLFGTAWGWSAFHLATLALYAGCIALRFLAAANLFERVAPSDKLASPVRSGPPPIYSVLVALRGENADTVEALVEALGALRWPKSRLQVLMVCERDDDATVAAVGAAIRGRPWARLVEAPPSLPRTKPKALNFALPLAEGEFLVLYDAEDKPAPEQLLRAFETFDRAGADLACLQAPLVVANGRAGWLPAHFAIEYTALFFGLLPWLGRRGMPLPLGGTSNHFRRESLVAVGGWDSHNVTEDADLGMRLARCGYRTGTINAPTLEDAPERWIDWHKQRTRWMKGYLQTYLVHMRNPAALWRGIGARDFAVFQLLFAGMILSSLLNTVVLGALLHDGARVFLGGWPDGLEGVLLALDAAVLTVGFSVYAALALGASRRGRCTAALSELWTVPVYWFLVSLATLRAVRDLALRPHHWEKTPHGLAARRNDGA